MVTNPLPAPPPPLIVHQVAGVRAMTDHQVAGDQAVTNQLVETVIPHLLHQPAHRKILPQRNLALIRGQGAGRTVVLPLPRPRQSRQGLTQATAGATSRPARPDHPRGQPGPR